MQKRRFVLKELKLTPVPGPSLESVRVRERAVSGAACCRTRPAWRPGGQTELSFSTGHNTPARGITNSGGGNLKLFASTPFLYFVFAMAKLRAGVHEVARGRIGCKLGITPLNQMGLGVGGTHDIRGGSAVVAAVGR